MFKKIVYQDVPSNPPKFLDAAINTDNIISITTIEPKDNIPYVNIKFVDGTSIICIGSIEDFLYER